MFVLKANVLVVEAIKWFVKQLVSFLMSSNVTRESKKQEVRF